MRDKTIVDLYWKRDESALRATEEKYGPYLFTIAFNILSHTEDSEESVNDTYLKAWNSIPPHRPLVLSTYLGKITRQVSIDLYRKRNRLKRRATEYSLSLSELEECIPSGNSTEELVDFQFLCEAINTYLRGLTKDERSIFICRYYYMDPMKEIASIHEMNLSKVKAMLHGIRKGLKTFLQQEGYRI